MKISTSYRLSEEAIQKIKLLSEALGISQASVIELSIRIASKQLLSDEKTNDR